MSRARGSLSLALLALGFLSACSIGEDGGGHGVLLIAIDELRADHVSSLGYDRTTTPQLDRLAAEGMLFTQAFSAAPLLIPAHAALLTGCYPSISRRRIPDRIQLPEANRWSLPAGVPRLAVEFLAAGYATAAFLDTESLPPFGDYDDGFQVFDCDDPRDWRAPNERGGAALSLRLRAWLSELPRDANWFAYLHLRDLERVWLEPDPEWDDYFAAREGNSFVPPVGSTDPAFFSIPSSRWGGRPKTLAALEARYDGALRSVDETLGALFRSLDLEGRWRNTTVSVVGSYGLQLGESGLILCSGLLSVPDLHVPWILRPAQGAGGGPGELRGGQRLHHLASLIDVAPTLLDLEGIPVPSGTHGVSHLPVLTGERTRVRTHAFASCGRVKGAVVFGEEWALEELQFGAESPELIEQWFGSPEPEEELTQHSFYRYRKQAHSPLAGPASTPPDDVARELSATLANWQLNTYATWRVLQRPVAFEGGKDEAVVDRLRELGYLGEAP